MIYRTFLKRYQLSKQMEDVTKNYLYTSQKREFLKDRLIHLSRAFSLIYCFSFSRKEYFL